jgi:two-component system response regulator FixJ
MVQLTPREREIMQLIAVQCLTSKKAARVLGISFRTVETHRSHILQKTQARNIAELARQWAARS